MVDVTGLMYEVNMNGIALSQIQREAVDYVLPYVAKRWAVDGQCIKEIWEGCEYGGDVPPDTWTLPEIKYGELVLSDFQEVNDALYNYVLSYAKMRSAAYGITDYRKRKIRKECKELAYNIDMAEMF